jgi:hypothetical protein
MGTSDKRSLCRYSNYRANTDASDACVGHHVRKLAADRIAVCDGRSNFL